jgi:fructose/tagatose bisphosphate aldolase
VKLRPELLQKHQEYVAEKIGVAKDSKPVYLVFHGGSGSSVDDFRQAISYGVVKVNLDTDMQWAYLSGVRDFIQSKKDYLQVGTKWLNWAQRLPLLVDCERPKFSTFSPIPPYFRHVTNFVPEN